MARDGLVQLRHPNRGSGMETIIVQWQGPVHRGGSLGKGAKDFTVGAMWLQVCG